MRWEVFGADNHLAELPELGTVVHPAADAQVGTALLDEPVDGLGVEEDRVLQGHADLVGPDGQLGGDCEMATGKTLRALPIFSGSLSAHRSLSINAGTPTCQGLS